MLCHVDIERSSSIAQELLITELSVESMYERVTPVVSMQKPDHLNLPNAALIYLLVLELIQGAERKGSTYVVRFTFELSSIEI